MIWAGIDKTCKKAIKIISFHGNLQFCPEFGQHFLFRIRIIVKCLAGFAFSKCLLVFDFFTQKGCEKLIKLLNGSHGLRGQFLYGCFLCPSGGSIYLWRFLPKEMGFNLKDCNKKQTTKFIFKRWNQKSSAWKVPVVLHRIYNFIS